MCERSCLRQCRLFTFVRHMLCTFCFQWKLSTHWQVLFSNFKVLRHNKTGLILFSVKYIPRETRQIKDTATFYYHMYFSTPQKYRWDTHRWGSSNAGKIRTHTAHVFFFTIPSSTSSNSNVHGWTRSADSQTGCGANLGHDTAWHRLPLSIICR